MIINIFFAITGRDRNVPTIVNTADVNTADVNTVDVNTVDSRDIPVPILRQSKIENT